MNSTSTLSPVFLKPICGPFMMSTTVGRPCVSTIGTPRR